MNDTFAYSFSELGTVITICVVGDGATPRERSHREQLVHRAAAWFGQVNSVCSRFDPQSELRRLCAQPGVAVEVSPMLFEVVQFALCVAEDTNGAFDPAVGADMEARGFSHEHRGGADTRSDVAPGATYRDISIDPAARTITCHRPLVIDLGGVAKGLAIDVAARELGEFGSFLVDAGGDVFCAGTNESGAPWSVGVRHPREANEITHVVRVSGEAICTSGDYERTSDAGHHLLDGRTRTTASSLASVTVIAPTAMAADALATAAFALGPDEGAALLARHELDGLLMTPDMDVRMTGSMAARVVAGSATVGRYA